MTATTKSPGPDAAAALTLWWVRLYTAGLAPASRHRRLEQVQSDLWEHKTDRLSEGADTAVIGLETLGRAARGVPADLLWRFKLEGPKMQISIPIERIGGAILLLLVVAALLSLTVAGYDPDTQGFEGELRRLADIEGWQVTMYTTLQVVSGLGMLGGAVVLCLALRRYSATLALLSAVALASAGLLALVTSAIYVTAAELADEWVAATPEHSDTVLTTARAFVLALSAIVPVTSVTLALSVYGFAVITARHHLVPHWLGFVVAASAVALAAALATGALADSGAPWLFLMIGFGLLLLWLLVAGGWLLLGGSSGSSTSEPERDAAVREGVAPRPVK